MNITLRVFVAILGCLFVMTVYFFLIRKKINERNSVVWLFGTFVIILFSASPKLLDVISRYLGVDYPPALIFLLAILAIMLIILNQTIQISLLQEKCRELTQQLAIIKFMQQGKQDIMNSPADKDVAS